MTKVPNHPLEQIKPGTVLGSDNLPFESLIFPNESAATGVPNTADTASASHYVSGSDPARRVAETPQPAISKLFRPKA